jgi:iron complex transport system substrate-binding protein
MQNNRSIIKKDRVICRVSYFNPTYDGDGMEDIYRKVRGVWVGFLVLMAFALVPVRHAVSAETVTDAKGRTVSVARPFTRIISLYGGHTENLVEMGLCSSIIGVNGGDEGGKTGNCDKPEFSYHDNPEKFFAAKPDLVLIRPMIDRAYPELVNRLTQRGITVMSYQPGDVNEMYDYWVNLGVLTGKKDKALAMVNAFKQELERAGERVKKIKQKKRVYFESMHKQMKTFSKDSMAVFCLETAGGINVAGDAVSSRGTNIGNYGKEKILSHASEIDVFLVQNGPMNQVSVDTVKSEPGFQIIKAVKEGKIYIIDELLVSRPTPRLILGIKAIEKALYPEAVKR